MRMARGSASLLSSHSRVEAEKQISELEDKMVDMTSKEQNKVKRVKRTEGSLRDLWDNQTNQHSNYRGPKRRREKQKV